MRQQCSYREDTKKKRMRMSMNGRWSKDAVDE
jgi:hypothetical protein